MALTSTVFRHPLEWNIGDKVGLKHIQKYVYPYLTRRYGANDVLFINYGYEEDPAMDVPLDQSDEANRFCIQLYHRVAAQADLTGKRVLEIGCGHGGGASYLVRTSRPRSYTGLDLNPVGIEFCRRRHPLPGLTFVTGDAQDLPFPDGSFDIVINIESSIHYPDFAGFLTEVARVLVPGGRFLYTDGRTAADIAEWQATLEAAPMRLISQTEINTEVVRALQKNPSKVAQQGVHRRVPALLRSPTRLWSAWVYRALQSGRISYRIYAFAKD